MCGVCWLFCELCLVSFNLFFLLWSIGCVVALVAVVLGVLLLCA